MLSIRRLVLGVQVGSSGVKAPKSKTLDPLSQSLASTLISIIEFSDSPGQGHCPLRLYHFDYMLF